MKRFLWTAGIVCLLGTTLEAADTNPAPAKGDPRAASLLQEASGTRYSWSPDIAAVSGKIAWGAGRQGRCRNISVRREPQRPDHYHRGRHAGPRRGQGARRLDDQPPRAAVSRGRQLPVAGGRHRRGGRGRGPLVLTVGDPMHSTQRVKDSRLVQVNRLMGGKLLHHRRHRIEKAPDGHRVFPAAFTVTWWTPPPARRWKRNTTPLRASTWSTVRCFPKRNGWSQERTAKHLPWRSSTPISTLKKGLRQELATGDRSAA